MMRQQGIDWNIMIYDGAFVVLGLATAYFKETGHYGMALALSIPGGIALWSYRAARDL